MKDHILDKIKNDFWKELDSRYHKELKKEL